MQRLYDPEPKKGGYMGLKMTIKKSECSCSSRELARTSEAERRPLQMIGHMYDMGGGDLRQTYNRWGGIHHDWLWLAHCPLPMAHDIGNKLW